MEFTRIISSQLSTKASTLLLGPRQTGKTSLIKKLSLLRTIDLLLSDEFLKYNKNPDLLYREVSELPEKIGTIAIDEVQKVPALLDIVHKLIEEHKQLHFILSGSSARKLKHGAANLLGGRALDIKIFPLSFFELSPDQFSLSTMLEYGSLPKIYGLVIENELELARALLNSYVTTYLQEEIKSEALVRNLPGFQRFLDVAAAYFARQVNYSYIAEHAGISDQTVKDYYSILEDTLIGFFLVPYSLSAKEKLSSVPKFYFFDNGVTRALLGQLGVPLSNQEKGYYFEQYVVQEIHRVSTYFSKNLKASLWRTQSGSEVDIVLSRGLNPLVAIECKSSAIVSRGDMSGLQAIKRRFPQIKSILCAPVSENRREEDGIEVLKPETLFQLVKDL